MLSVKRYLIFKVTNKLNDPKGSKNGICTMVKYGETFYGRHTSLNTSQTFLDSAMNSYVVFPQLQHTLNLKVTSPPNLKIRCLSLSPTDLKSDHEIILIILREQPRRAFLWKKASIQRINSLLWVKNLANDILKYFSYFSQKKVLIFHAGCGDNLHEISKPFFFWGK